MKLSMSLIGTYLEKYQPECHISEDTMSISGVRFLSASLGKFSKDYVYIGDAREYYQDIRYRDALLLTNGQNQILCRGADYEELLNDVLSAFEYYNQMEQRLILSAAQGSSLNELIQIMEPVYAGGILFFDMEGNLLVARHEEVLRGDPLYEELENNGRMELYTLGRVFMDKAGKVSHDLSDYARRLFVTGEMLGTVAMYLTIHQERVGFLMMFPVSELEAMAALHLEELFARCSVMAKEFTDTSSRLMPKRTILESILKGTMPEPEVLQQLELAVEMKADGRVLVLENLGIQNYTMYHMLERDLALAGKNIACEYQNYFVVLTSTEVLSKLTEMHSGKNGIWKIYGRDLYGDSACRADRYGISSGTFCNFTGKRTGDLPMRNICTGIPDPESEKPGYGHGTATSPDRDAGALRSGKSHRTVTNLTYLALEWMQSAKGCREITCTSEYFKISVKAHGRTWTSGYE